MCTLLTNGIRALVTEVSACNVLVEVVLGAAARACVVSIELILERHQARQTRQEEEEEEEEEVSVKRKSLAGAGTQTVATDVRRSGRHLVRPLEY